MQESIAQENKMKTARIAVLIVLALATMALAESDAQKSSESEAQRSFKKLEALAGMWEGKNTNGQAVQVAFRVTSRGSAIMSEIQGEEDMISMIHLDGDRLLLTHYCGAGNQPRMKATASPDGKTITFNFVDATNLASPQAGHMQRVIFTIPDADHHSEDWFFVQDGKEGHERFNLAREGSM
jgi:hypothetical protein